MNIVSGLLISVGLLAVGAGIYCVSVTYGDLHTRAEDAAQSPKRPALPFSPVMRELFGIETTDELTVNLPESNIGVPLRALVVVNQRRLATGRYADGPERGTVALDYMNINTLNMGHPGVIYFIAPFSVSNQGSGVFHYLGLFRQDIARHSIQHMDAYFLGDRIDIVSVVADPESARIAVSLRERSLPEQPRQQRKQLHIRLHMDPPRFVPGS